MTQPRDHAVPCVMCGYDFKSKNPHPSTYTFNVSGFCDQHEQELADAQIFKTVEEARNDFA